MLASKGGYPYFSDAGWNVVDSPTFVGVHADFSTGAASKRDLLAQHRLDLAINYSMEPILPIVPGALLTLTLGTDALSMKAAMAPLHIGKDVYGSSWARISAQDAQGFMHVVVAGGGITGTQSTLC